MKYQNNYSISIQIFILIIIIQVLTVPSASVAFWGEGNNDCIAEHGITYQNATYLPNCEIDIDGVPDEAEWYSEDVEDYFVPTAGENTTDKFFLCYSYLKFIYNDEYLYISARWNDTTPYAVMDMFTFCWDINCDNFTTAMFVDPNMMTSLNESQYIDCWKWGVSGHSNGSYYPIQDIYYNTEWGSTSEEKQNIYTAFTYRSDLGHYFLELRKPLVGDDLDVNFEMPRTNYRYSIAIMDDMRDSFHAVSWTYELQFNDLKDLEASSSLENSIPFMFGNITIIGSILCIGIISLKTAKKILKKQF